MLQSHLTLEVMARVKSLLRRAEHNVKNNEPDQIEIGPLIIKKILMR